MSTSRPGKQSQGSPSATGISNLTHQEFEAALKKTSLAILPVGSLEQHGPHLPASTDSIIVTRIAEKVARELRSFLLPVVAFGVSFEHAPFLNVSIRNRTLSSLVADVCDSMGQNGVHEVVILNGHHGNVGSLQCVAYDLAERGLKDMKVYALNYWHFIGAEFDHAGETETSLMLSISPDLVQMDRAEASSRKLDGSKAVYSAITNIPGSFPAITGNGVWGDPRKASKEKGEKLEANAVNGLVAAIRELKKFRGVQL